MSPMQQIFLGLGAGGTKTYIDDVFSTQVYTGSGSARSINNGVDLTNGGLVWTQIRNTAWGSILFDTERGTSKHLHSWSNAAEDTDSTQVTAFNNNGYSLGTDQNSGLVNYNNTKTYASWTFRKAPGFFDCVTYTGNGSSRTIAHSLGCQPGRIIIKCTSKTGDWLVNDYAMDNNNGNLWAKLNENGQYLGAGQYTGSTGPTSTSFTLGTANEVNETGETFVAYIFAGGDRTGNASVKFQGQNGYLKFKDTSDWEFTGQFSLEYWVYMTANNEETPTITWGSGTYRALFWSPGTSNWRFQWPTGNSNVNMGGTAPTNTWKHHVLTRDSSNVLRFFIDGELIYNTTESDNLGGNEQLFLGHKANNVNYGLKNGNLSNVRIIKGSIPTTYQTSSTTNGASIFTSPTAPLTKTSQGATSSDVKLICCNDIGAAQATYINDCPGIINYGNIGAKGSTESPFSATLDASAVFGANEKPIIRTGQYMGSGSATAGNTVDIGFEPSYVMIKRSGGSGNWFVHDSMRGIVTGGNDPYIMTDTSDPESGSYDLLDLTPTGFKLKTNSSAYNANEEGYVYVAVRRSDGYVGKPSELGTDVFAMDTGNNGTTIPVFDSGFPVDFAFHRAVDSTSTWFTGARLIQGKYIQTDGDNGEASSANWVFDSNTGYSNDQKDSAWQSWMWKRHAGFDVVTFTGNGTAGHTLSHSLNAVPEMIWVKGRSLVERWIVYHKGLNGGSSPEDYYLSLNKTQAESDHPMFNDTAPTSTAFTLGSHNYVNKDTDTFIAMLFSSVDKISKVGYYDGQNTDLTITTGFQPRFVLIKCTTDATDWNLFDTVRGWTLSGAGDSKILRPNVNNAQYNGNVGEPTSTGFLLKGNRSTVNKSGRSFVYYAHA